MFLLVNSGCFLSKHLWDLFVGLMSNGTVGHEAICLYLKPIKYQIVVSPATPVLSDAALLSLSSTAPPVLGSM